MSVTNAFMRKSEIKANGYTHIEAWSDSEVSPIYGGTYYPVLCTSKGHGFPQYGTLFESLDAVKQWAKDNWPELPFKA